MLHSCAVALVNVIVLEQFSLETGNSLSCSFITYLPAAVLIYGFIGQISYSADTSSIDTAAAAVIVMGRYLLHLSYGCREHWSPARDAYAGCHRCNNTLKGSVSIHSLSFWDLSWLQKFEECAYLDLYSSLSTIPIISVSLPGKSCFLFLWGWKM